MTGSERSGIGNNDVVATRPSGAAIAIPDDAEMDRCERLLTECTCIPTYKDRDLTDPQCEACNLGSEIIDTFKAMRANLCRAIDAEANDAETRCAKDWDAWLNRFSPLRKAKDAEG